MKLLIISFLVSFTSYSQTAKLWGLTEVGGEFNLGTIFTSNIDGTNIETNFSFPYSGTGVYPTGELMKAINGKYYGIVDDKIYEYNPEISQYFLRKIITSDIGSGITGSFIQANDGWLYITSLGGGLNSAGSILRYNYITNSIENVYSFDIANFINPKPLPNDLFQASDGNLYGTSKYGGLTNQGMIYRFNPLTQVFTTLHDFDDLFTTGILPCGALIQASNGKLYGLTESGGAGAGGGTLFEFDILTSSFVKKVNFLGFGNANGYTGTQPQDKLIEAVDGKLYGVCVTGGFTQGEGTIFNYDIVNDTCFVRKSFYGGENGSQPESHLVQADNGNLLGQTKLGGTFDKGTIFELNPVNGSFNTLYHYTVEGANKPLNGFYKLDNNKFISTLKEGFSSFGEIIEFDYSQNTLSALFEFGIAHQRYRPQNLYLADNNKFYGLSSSGGKNNELGYLIEYDPNLNEIRECYDFSDNGNGNTPEKSLIEVNPGVLYGLAGRGGLFDEGVIFSYNYITNVYSKIHDLNEFNGLISNSNYGETALTLASNGIIYGTTRLGGANNFGILFSIDPTNNSYTKLVDFSINIRYPLGELIDGNNGVLYGVSTLGGTGYGTLYAYNINQESIYTLKSFNMSDGASPVSLCLYNDSLLYGICSVDGLLNNGSIFEYNIPQATYQTKHYFGNAGSEYYNWSGYLSNYSDGCLYVIERLIGDNENGRIVKYNPIDNSLLTTSSFLTSFNGADPYGNLTEYSPCESNYFSIQNESVCMGSDYQFPDGSFTSVTTTTPITNYNYLMTTNGCDSTIVTVLTVDTLSLSISQTNTTIQVNELNAAYQWLDCENDFTPIIGENNQEITPNYLSSFSCEITKNSCIDTTNCVLITTDDFYNSVNYLPLQAQVFTFPTTDVDSCDAIAISSISGGVQPWNKDWYTQINNENTNVIDSLCYGFHTLKITDNIGDTVLIDYYVTDSINYYPWYNTTQAYGDTIVFTTVNCEIDLDLPLDSATIIGIEYLYADINSLGDFYSISIKYYQNGNSWITNNVTLLDISGSYLLSLSIYCPNKSQSRIKTFVLSFNFPEILSITELVDLELIIYPIPARNQISLEYPITQNNEMIRLLNLSGQEMLSLNCTATNHMTIDVSGLSSGIYIIELINPTGILKRKFVIE